MNRERELIANIRARRDYIKYTNLPLTEGQAHQRQIKAWERELVALGGTVPAEAPKPKPPTGHVAIYHASRRVQFGLGGLRDRRAESQRLPRGPGRWDAVVRPAGGRLDGLQDGRPLSEHLDSARP
jgi:hypothetical protein